MKVLNIYINLYTHTHKHFYLLIWINFSWESIMRKELAWSLGYLFNYIVLPGAFWEDLQWVNCIYTGSPWSQRWWWPKWGQLIILVYIPEASWVCTLGLAYHETRLPGASLLMKGPLISGKERWCFEPRPSAICLVSIYKQGCKANVVLICTKHVH